MLGYEPFCRRDRIGTEIVMPGAGNTHEALGRLDQAKQPLAEDDGNDSVVLAVYHQHGRHDLANAPVRVKLILHKEPHRHEPVVLHAHVDGRGEGGLEHKAPNWFFGCQRDRQRRAEQLAHRTMRSRE